MLRRHDGHQQTERSAGWQEPETGIKGSDPSGAMR